MGAGWEFEGSMSKTELRQDRVAPISFQRDKSQRTEQATVNRIYQGSVSKVEIPEGKDEAGKSK